jgi:PKD repeat protein
MIKHTLFILLLVIPFIGNSQSKLTYNEYFDYNNGYCPGDPQYDNWVGLITSLDTTADKYLKITMRGTYDMVGKSCTDKYAVRQIADALYNGYDASISCDGMVWTVGTGCSDYNCGNSADYIELTLNQYTCNCGTSYTIRPGMTSPNWGGINTETCQWWYQNANQDMIVEIERIYGNDNLSARSFVTPNECAYTQNLYANIMNIGNNTVNNYYVGYSINGVSQTPVYITNSLLSDETIQVLLKSNYTFTANTSYTFKIWTYSPNGNTDSETSNDTITVNYLHSGAPSIPTASNIIKCGVGKQDISASSTDSIGWFDVPSGGSMLTMGSSFTTPFLYRTDTFYAEALRFKSTSNKFGSGFNNYTMISYDQGEYNGAMLKVRANELLRISGIKVQSVFGNTSPHYTVYYRKGGFAGYESDSTAWTRVFDAPLSNGGSLNTIPVTLVLEPGVDYGLYVTTNPASGEDIWVNYGASTYSNSDISMTGGNSVYGKFGRIGVYTPWTLDCEIFYEKTCTSTGRKPVVVTVNPKPFGSDIIAATGFAGKYSLGLLNDPDVSEINKQLEYEFTPPTGYNNSDHGSTWEVNSVYLETEYGTPVNTSLYSFTNPGSGGNGVLTFTPDVNLLDSNIRVKIKTSDLGPYFCDTIVSRIIHIAPTPFVNFKFPSSICEGDDVYFTNLSTIYSGGITYKWEFTSTDSSDFVEPVQRFDVAGTYYVKLTATSSPYGISKDTTIAVLVGQIPLAAFKTINACEGNSVVFNNQTPGTGIVYTWNFGDNTPISNATSPSHLYTIPKAYSVKMTANRNGCIATVIKNAYVFPTPVASFTAPVQAICMNQDINFDNTSTISSGKIGSLWNFNDGKISTIEDATHAFSAPGTYNVVLKMLSEFGCADSVNSTVTIKPAPVVDFTVDRLCKNDISKFVNTSTEFPGINSAYSWTFSDGASANTKNYTRVWPYNGPKTVKLKSVLTNGCEAEVEKSLTVLTQPKADFKTMDICEDHDAMFANLSSIEDGELNYQWYFGDNSAVNTDYNPTHRYSVSTTTTYTVNLVVSVPGGCDDTAARSITITTIPTCDFTVAPYNPVGFNTYKFTPVNSSYDAYEWFFGEGGTSTNVSPLYQYTFVGAFDVTLKAKDADCQCSNTKRVGISETGIDVVNSNKFKLYPNPSDKFITIDLISASSASVKVLNQLGQVVLNKDLSQLSTELYIGDLNSGIYTVEVMIDGVKSVTKLSIVH